MKSSLDYERETQYIFTLHSPSNPNLNIIINVQDTNDNIPTLAISPQFVRITTNFPISSLVAVAKAQDDDKESQFSYSIVSGDPDGNLVVDSDSGFVRVAQCLSYAELGLQRIVIQVNDGRFVANQTLEIEVYRPTDNSFGESCGLECNPITFSITSIADGNVTFTDVERNGKILSNAELIAIVDGGSSNDTDYTNLKEGIASHLKQFYERRYELQQFEIIGLTVLDAAQQPQQQQSVSNETTFLNAKYIFEVKTITNATLGDFNPIEKNETITLVKNENVTFTVQTNPELSLVSGKHNTPFIAKC